MEAIAQASSELPSSVNLVLSNDDILTEILLRLPVPSLLRFKTVSKHYMSLIKSPYFTFRRNKNHNLDTPSGLFLMQTREVAYNFIRLHTPNKSPLLDVHFPFRSDNNGECDLEIMNSCNGLLLCFIKPDKLFVYNPSINQFKLLPNEYYSKLAKHMFYGVKLAFDPTKSCHYKVIYVRLVYDVHRAIQIISYSSKTGCWSFCRDLFPMGSFSDFHNGIYWNGAIHWLSILGLHYKLDVDSLVLTTISKLGSLDGNLRYDFHHKLFVSRGCLFLACNVSTICTRNRQLNVYEMRNGCSEWLVKYVIDIDDFRMLIPGTWEIPDANLSFVRCIVVGEREEDSFLVLGVCGKIVRYNVVLKTLSKICDFGPPREEHFSRQCFPFIPSLASV